MRLLGIDYGEKNIGLALSDDKGLMAFPEGVISNDKKTIETIFSFIKANKVIKVVVGDSKDFQGKPNKIMQKVMPFVETLKEKGVEVILEPEFMSSQQAEFFMGKTKMLDASAATIILQSYIDKQKPTVSNDEYLKNKIMTNEIRENKDKVKTADAQQASLPVAPEAPKHISYDDFAKVELKVGKILSAEALPKSEKLLRLSVDFAEGSPRTILSGIAKYFPEGVGLVGKRCMFVTNLEPRKMMGQESNGMILAVSTDAGFSLLEPNESIPEGTKAK